MTAEKPDDAADLDRHQNPALSRSKDVCLLQKHNVFMETILVCEHPQRAMYGMRVQVSAP